MSGASLALAATLACAGALALVLRAEIGHDRGGRYRWKPLASLAFIAVPLCAGAVGGDGARAEAAGWVLAGLVLGAVGDVLLMFDARRAFLGGLVAFLLGHIAYVIAFATLAAPATWLAGPMALLVAIPALAGAVVLRWLWPHLGSLRLPVIAYVLVISVMVVGGAAISVHGSALGARGDALATAGAVAFYASDLTVARDRFVAKGVENKLIGLPLYYGAQLLIAWSVVG